MKTLLKLAACAAVLTAAAACGDKRGPDGLTSEESEKLNEHAEELDKNGVVDTSPDSLTVNGAGEEWSAAEDGREAPPENGASPDVNGQ